ncbi:MAG: HyaD/HybD family hydrogenase maturation endopeptidase [bacterium]
MNKYTLTILGLGNILFKDEGFGVHFVRTFQEKYKLPDNALIVDGGTLGYMLMDTICQTEHLVVIDTVKADDLPGSVYRFHPDAIPTHLSYNVSAHEVEFMDLLLKADMMGEAPETTFITVVPEDIVGKGMNMTETMNKCLPKIEKLVLEEMKRLSVCTS